MDEGRLYKQSFSWSLLRCLRPSEIEFALREVYEGIYGDYISKRVLVYKLLWQGYYWPIM